MIIKLVVKKTYESWYENKLLHRDGGPAIINSDGNIVFFIRGERKGWMHKDE